MPTAVQLKLINYTRHAQVASLHMTCRQTGSTDQPFTTLDSENTGCRFGIVQEISDDIGRHNSDAQVNSALVTVLRGHEELQSQWKHLQPGDIVKVSPDHWHLTFLPACIMFCKGCTWCDTDSQVALV